MVDYASKIKSGRTGKGLYQKELAAAIGVGERNIQRYECGKVSPPLEKRILLANIFDDPTFLTDEERRNLDNKEFLLSVERQYGKDAKTQAESHLEQLAVLCSGGKLKPEDEDAVLSSMKSIIFDIQERKAREAGRG